MPTLTFSRPKFAWAAVSSLTLAAFAIPAIAQTAGATSTESGLYSATTVPQTTDAGDPAAVELGTKFSSATAGSITGVRFYKSALNTGVHTGSLWSATGQRLATGTFVGETVSGWQTMHFAKPVNIAAGQNYIASYYDPHGHYADRQWAFANGATISRAPLTGKAGTYKYGASGFPTSAWHASAYYVEPLWTAPVGTAAPSPTPTTGPTGAATPSPTSTTTAPPTSPATAPATAPATSSAPTTTTSAPSSPSSTGFPSTSNTGTTGTLTTVNGDFSTSASGQIVKDKLITGDFIVNNPNVTLQNSRVLGRIVTQVESNLQITDSDIGGNTCTGSSPYELLASGSVSVLRSHLHNGGADLVRVGAGSATITDSLIDNGCIYPGDHFDAVQFYDPGAVGKVTINHSTLDGRPLGNSTTDKGNAAVFWADSPGAGSVLTITNSQLAGGNFTVSLYDANAGSGVLLDVRDNTFVKGSSQYGPCSMSNSIAYNGKEGVRFTGNVYSDGTALPSC